MSEALRLGYALRNDAVAAVLSGEAAARGLRPFGMGQGEIMARLARVE
ncbi:hypothetical protein BCF74_11737 [Knoellia remsis]|uniref:Uncharacterized protein n=1 Tax=Knoellia remsis TaxID=407159 RepID=A0A2T0UGK0_9MICO|nr:hypothetical protein [Knoellia remsis]PRY57032.1 hypothetical protein BCF74_11737 [Knoellia remsis]